MRPVDTERAVGRGGRTTVPRGPVGPDRVGGGGTRRGRAPFFMPPGTDAGRDDRPGGPGDQLLPAAEAKALIPIGGEEGGVVEGAA